LISGDPSFASFSTRSISSGWWAKARLHTQYNHDGEFVEASLESIAAAVEHPTQIRDDFRGSIADAPGEGAYPIASFTWIVVPAHP
jgi:hypothetical protein